MKKIVIYSLTGLVAIAVTLLLIYKQNIERMMFVNDLFTGAEQYQNFNRVKEIMPVTTMTASQSPYDFEISSSISLPDSFNYQNNQVPTSDFLTETDTSALLVIQQGKIHYENYSLTGGRYVNWLSMSVAKSFIATAIGIASDDGKIDIEKPITDYVPTLKNSAYENVRIKDVLQMSSGAAWREDYSDPESDVMRLGMIMATGGSMDEFIANMETEFPAGTVNRYNSGDTQALGMLLKAATKQSITDYVQEKLWTPLGMESNAYWLKDDENMEMAFAGLNATARDYAKLGELYRQKGQWQGTQIVSAQWVHDATTPDAPHIQPYAHKGDSFGYGYQWWIPDSNEGEFTAIGVYNQFIYVNPARELVIVKLSANSDYALEDEEKYYREKETIEFFRQIAQFFDVQTTKQLASASH